MHQVHQRIGAAAGYIIRAQIGVILQHKIGVRVLHANALAIKLHAAAIVGANSSCIGDGTVADSYIDFARVQ